jgi:hypothetical protein
MEGGKSIIGEFADALAKLAGIDAGTLGAIFATLAGAVGLAAAASSIGLMTAALNPLTASLLAFAGAFALAKAGFEYFDKLKSEADAKIEATKATDNPRARPGYVEPVGADIARDANGNAIVDANGQPVVKRYGPALNMRGAAVVDQPRPANLENSMTQGALDWKTMMENAEGNALKMRDGAPTNAVVNDNKQDNRNQSVTVQVGGVTVQGVQNVSPAVGAAVGNAVGNSAASAVPRASRFEKDDAF